MTNVKNPYFDPSKSHHTPDGFRNPDGKGRKRLRSILKWKWSTFWQNRGKTPPAVLHADPPTTPCDLPLLDRAAEKSTASPYPPMVTWLGHATALVQHDRLSILTDPMFSKRASPSQCFGPRRYQLAALPISQLPHIDVVVISHNHYDHLDETSVCRLNKQPGGPPLFLVPLGLKPWMATKGITHVVELDWWQSHTVSGVQFFCTPAQHWSARSLWDAMRTLWCSWSILGPNCSWYFAGDTGYSNHFSETRLFFEKALPNGFDLALLPIGAYAPRLFMQHNHMNPDDAVQAHRDLQAQRSLGIHWGCFKLTDEPLDEPPLRLSEARQKHGLAEDDFFVLPIGATYTISGTKA
ncbi:MAG: MBL fold metallo-hydrolase [Pseudomonadota bacterium]